MAILGMTICYAAYMSEVYRAGIQSIGKGQMEAARSLGMSQTQAMRYVILPQAIRVILPPMGNEFISLLKDSSLVSVVAVADLTRRGREFSSTYGHPDRDLVDGRLDLPGDDHPQRAGGHLDRAQDQNRLGRRHGRTNYSHRERISKTFGTVEALKSVSLDVDKGEVVVIIGPSGSGKSTLLRCINRLEEFDSGQIIVDGIPLDTAENINAVRTEVGMVFQQFNLFPHLTVLENITLAQQVMRKRSKVRSRSQGHAAPGKSGHT